ncbi:MAG: PD40 domain-containing protein, partial [Candidatus Aminicenantes bacterium]|nr:PD40 domain-containing protein [Candidatus Aminicenantes bacterium]
DGEEIVFSGQKDLQNDIYIFTIASDKIRALTNDIYSDSQPRWSRDGSRIVFTSERSIYPDSTRQNLFNELNNDIFFYEMASGDFYQVTDDSFSNQFPLWDSSGHKILFVSERNFATNFEIIDINSGERAIVTSSLGGKFTGDLDKNDENLIFSCYYNGGWDLYQKSYPLRDLEFFAYHQPYPVQLSPEFKEKIALDRLQYYGRKEKKSPPETGKLDRDNKVYPHHGEIVWQDSTFMPPKEDIDPRPQEINPPRIMPYQTRFTLDYLWGGMAYSPSGGTYAQLQMGLSDLMGNHGIGINVGVSGEIDNSNILVNYLYLARRVDYGIGAFYLNDEIIYRITSTDPSQESDYFREREREYGCYLITRYPFSKFWRLDMENLFYRNELRRDWWNNLTEKWQEEYLPQEIQEDLGLKEKEEEFIWAPQVSLVHDNSIFGMVGPISGWRGTLILSRSFSTKKSYSVIYSDLRKYFFFEKRFSYALRLFGGTIMGDTNSRF